MDEPLKDRDPANLHPAFRAKLEQLQLRLLKAGQPFKLDETYRTPERQAWLYAQGRTIPGPDVSAKRPMGRTVTQKDGAPGVWPADHSVVSERGKTRRSRHQSRLAADLYPVRSDGRVFIPPANHEAWYLLASTARALGLRSGRSWGDSPHVEWQGPLPKETP